MAEIPDMKELVKKYPSLKKFEELGDKYVEVSSIAAISLSVEPLNFTSPPSPSPICIPASPGAAQG